MIKIKKSIKVIKQSGVKTKSPVKVVKKSKHNFVLDFPKFEEVKEYCKAPEYKKIEALQKKNPGFKIRIQGGGCKRLMSAFYAKRFKSGTLNVLEVPELRNSVNYSDRAVLLALGKIVDTGTLSGSISACEIERVKGSPRKLFRIKIK